MIKNYDARICCSRLNKHLINTICREKLLKNKPDLEGINISENMILTSMIKYYTDYISLKEFENEFNSNKCNNK